MGAGWVRGCGPAYHLGAGSFGVILGPYSDLDFKIESTFWIVGPCLSIIDQFRTGAGSDPMGAGSVQRNAIYIMQYA